jgi:hypothetical protein
VEASIERRGNRIVGIAPRVVTVVPPKKRLSQWEVDRRQQIEEALNREAVIVTVAREPTLLMKVLALIEDEGAPGSEAAHQIVADALVRAARAVAPEAAELAGSPIRRTRKRDAAEWVELLRELATQLANGQFYNRDLPAIDAPIRDLVDHYLRRVGERRP